MDTEHVMTRQERREQRKKPKWPLDNRKSVRLTAELAVKPKKGKKR